MKDEPRQRLSDDHMAFARLDGEIETHQRGYLRTPGTGGIDQARRCDRALARQHTANGPLLVALQDRKSTRLNSSHSQISYAVFCLKKKTGVVPCQALSSATEHKILSLR